MKCVYQIRNLANNKIYIGSAFDNNKRWAGHKCDLIADRHHSILLQRGWNKYGEWFFKFEIIEIVEDKTKLIEREQHWMDLLKPEYNIAKAAGSPLGVIRSLDTRNKIRDAVLGTQRDDLKKLELWPHGSKCGCDPCSEKRKIYYKEYNKKRVSTYEWKQLKRIKEHQRMMANG